MIKSPGPPLTPKPSKSAIKRSKSEKKQRQLSLASTATVPIPEVDNEIIPSNILLGEGLLCVDNNLANSNLVAPHVIDTEVTVDDAALLADIECKLAADNHENPQLEKPMTSTELSGESGIISARSTESEKSSAAPRRKRISMTSAPNDESSLSLTAKKAETKSVSFNKLSTPVMETASSKSGRLSPRQGLPEKPQSPTSSEKQNIVQSAELVKPDTARTTSTADSNATTQTSRSKAPTKKQNKVEETFAKLAKVMPNFKVDRRMRQQIIQSLKEINCWSDDEEDEKAAQRKKQQEAQRRRAELQSIAASASLTVDTDQSNGRVRFATPSGEDSPNTSAKLSGIAGPVSPTAARASSAKPCSSGPSSPSATLASMTSLKFDSTQALNLRALSLSPTTSLDEYQSPSSPFARALTPGVVPDSVGSPGRERVTLMKPKQIVDSPHLVALENKKKADREAVRENVMHKAIHIIVQMRKENDESKQINFMSLLKEQSSAKYIAVKRATFGIVDRALKRAKRTALTQMDKLLDKQHRYAERVIKMGIRFLGAYRRSRFRRFCYCLLREGRRILRQRLQDEEAEWYAFRRRAAQRRMDEDLHFSDWKAEQKVHSTFPIPSHELKEKANELTGLSKMVMDANGDIVISTTADDRLLSRSFSAVRPDLSPFSDHVNGKIYRSLRPVPATMQAIVSTNDGFVFNERERFTRTSVIAPDAERNASIFAPKTVTIQQHPIGDSPQKPSSYKPMPPRVAQRSTQLYIEKPPQTVSEGNNYFLGTKVDPKTGSIARSNNLASQLSPLPNSVEHRSFASPVAASAAIAAVTASFAVHAGKPTRAYKEIVTVDDTTQELPMWEQLARLDNTSSVAMTREASKVKSSAFQTLEKLCGLSEEDIRRHQRTAFGDIAGRKPLYNTNLLSLFSK